MASVPIWLQAGITALPLEKGILCLLLNGHIPPGAQLGDGTRAHEPHWAPEDKHRVRLMEPISIGPGSVYISPRMENFPEENYFPLLTSVTLIGRWRIEEWYFLIIKVWEPMTFLVFFLISLLFTPPMYPFPHLEAILSSCCELIYFLFSKYGIAVGFEHISWFLMASTCLYHLSPQLERWGAMLEYSCDLPSPILCPKSSGEEHSLKNTSRMCFLMSSDCQP